MGEEKKEKNTLNEIMDILGGITPEEIADLIERADKDPDLDVRQELEKLNMKHSINFI